MQLTGTEIINSNIITNYCNSGIQQQGIDVRVKDVYKFKKHTNTGVIKLEKSEIPETEKDEWEVRDDIESIYLGPGYYEIMLVEGCNIPQNYALTFKTRSSLVRCGAIVHSGQFDAGFKTNNMGCFLQVIRPIIIYKNARIAQAIVVETQTVSKENLYNGQWQHDKQRDKIQRSYS